MTKVLTPSFISDFIAAIRVKQWIKNLIIPGVGAAMLTSSSDLNLAAVHLGLAFFAFCLAASSIYVLNDLMDLSKDRAHPTKRARPIASGRLSHSLMWILLALVMPCAVYMAWNVNPRVATLVLAYLAINIGYCVKLKHVPQVDIVCVASGFTIRALIGAFSVGRTVDFWLLAAITFACVGLALMKRMKELKNLGASGNTRPVLEGYDYETLLRAHDMFMVLAVLSATLFLEHSTKSLNNPLTVAACLTFISAMFLVFIHRVQGDTDGDPTSLIYRHKYLAMSVLLLTITFILII